MAKTKPPTETPQDTEQHVPRTLATWDQQVAYAAANMAEDVAGRLVSVLVLLEHVQDPASEFPDDDGWTLSTARDLIEQCRTDLLVSLATPGAQAVLESAGVEVRAMKVEVLTDLDGRLFMVENRARVLKESLAAFAATVGEMPITEKALNGLSQIAEELADELDSIHAEYVRQADA